MKLINPNGTVNSRRHLAHDIRQTVTKMSEQERTHCLEAIQARAVLLEQQPNNELCQYITFLLNGKEPRKGIS